MTDEQVEAARLAVSHLRCSEAGGCFAPSGVDTADDCAAGDCYCTRQADREARAALAAAEAVAWQPIETAPKQKVIDVWLGDAEPEDIEFYCTLGTRRSAGWHWVQGKWRPIGGLPAMTGFVQPTHWRLPPEPPKCPLPEEIVEGEVKS